jgi:hypothetical protein
VAAAFGWLLWLLWLLLWRWLWLLRGACAATVAFLGLLLVLLHHHRNNWYVLLVWLLVWFWVLGFVL